MTRHVGSTLSLLNEYNLKLDPSRPMDLLNLHLRFEKLLFAAGFFFFLSDPQLATVQKIRGCRMLSP